MSKENLHVNGQYVSIHGYICMLSPIYIFFYTSSVQSLIIIICIFETFMYTYIYGCRQNYLRFRLLLIVY